jgi:hypothetical protein
MTPPNIISGFRKTGIFLLNDDTLPDSAFTASDLTFLQLPEKQGRGVKYYTYDDSSKLYVKILHV